MSDIENLAAWINNNLDKKGTDQWNAVAAGLRELSQTPEQPSEENALENYLQARADAENAKRTGVGLALKSSFDLTGEGIGSALEGVGSVLGLEGLEEYGADMALENEAQLQRAEKFRTRRQDVEGLGTGLSYFGETLAESSVPMGVGIGAGIAGAKIGARFGPAGALVGGLAGAIGSQIPLFYGWNRQRQKQAVEQGIIPEISEGAAFLSSLPQAGAEGIVNRLLVGGLFATPLMKQGGVLTRIGKGSVKGAAAEIPTEIGQQVIERAQAGLSLDSDEAISEYIDAGVAAGMIGGTVGGAGNIRATTPEMREEARRIEKEEARRIAAQEKIARLETEAEPDPTDEILAIQGPPEMQGPPDRPTALPAPGTPAVIRVDTEGKAKTSEELSVERNEGIKIAERARQEIRRTGEVSSKTMQDLRNANIPLESVSKVLEQTRMEPSLAKPLKGEANADTRRVDATRSRVGVQDVVSKTDDKDAKEPDALKKERVDSTKPGLGSDTDTEVIGDDTLEIEQLRLKEEAIGLEASEQERLNELTSTEKKKKLDPQVVKSDMSKTFGKGAQSIKYIDPESKGFIEIIQRPNGTSSVIGLEVPKKFRGRGIGQSLQEIAMEDNPNLMGQVSSKAAATIAYRLGRRPSTKSDATLEEVFSMIDKDSSVNMVTPEVTPDVTEVSTTKNKQPNGDYIISKVFRDKNGKSQVKRYTVENPKNNPETKSWLITPEGVDGDATDAANSLGDAVKLIEGFQETEVATEEVTEEAKTPVEEEPIFKDETETSLEGITKKDAAGAAFTRSQKANIDVVREKFTPQIDKIKNDKTIPKKERQSRVQALNGAMLVAINDIKQGIPQAEAAARYKKSLQTIKNMEDRAEVQAILDFKTAEMKEAGTRYTERRTEKTKKELIKEFRDTIDGKMGDLVSVAKRLELTPEQYAEQVKLYHKELRGHFENPPNVLSIRDMEVILETIQFKSRQPNVFFYKHFTMMQALYAAAYASAVEGGQIQRTGTPSVDAYYAGMNKIAGNKFRTWVNNNLSDEAIKWFETTRATIVNKDATSTNDRNAVAKDEAAAKRAKDWNLREGWEPYRKKLPEEYVVDIDIPIRPSTIAFLRNEELSLALADLAHTTPNKSIAELANRLIKYAGATKLKVVATMDSAGSFDPKTNTIRLNADSGLNTHTLLHEMAHAVVSAELSKKSSPTSKQVNTLFKAVKGLTGTAYGSTNLQEFVAEAMSNPKFQETLASVHIKGERISALQRLKNIIANFFRRITGKKTVALTYIPEFDPKIIKDEATALDALDTLINGNDIYESLLAPAPEFRNAGIMKLNSNPTSTKQTLSFLERINEMFAGKMDKAGRTRFAAESNEYLKTGKEIFTKGYLSLVGSQGLGDIAQGAGFGRLGYDADETMQRQRGAINLSDEAVREVVQEFTRWSKANPKAKITLDDLIYNVDYGSTIQQVDPTLTRTQAEEKYNSYVLEYTNDKGEIKRRYFKDKNKRDSVAEKFSDPKYDSSKLNPESEKFAIWKQQQPVWNSLKQSGGQQIYNKMNDTYKKMYAELKQTIEGRIDDAMGTDAETAKALKNKIFNKVFKVGTLDVYFPLVRKGRYILSYNLKPESVPKGADPYMFEMFATELERDYAAEDVKNNPNVRQETIEVKKNEILKIEDFQKTPPTSFVAQTLDILGKERKDKDGNTITVPSDVKQEILNLFLSTLPETSLAKQLKKRKGTPGFIPDSLIAMSTKAYDLGRQTKRLEYGAKLKNLQTKIDKLVPPPTAKKSFGEIRQELNKRLNYARNPPSQRVSKALNQGAFIYTIGFNISSALVNLSQVPLFVMPYLGARYGYPETAAAIGTMSKLVTSAKNNVTAMYDRAEDGTYTLKKDLELPDGLKKEYIKLAPVVQMAAERGLLTTSFTQDVLGLDESGRERSVADKISAFSAIPFNHGERFNRQVTILSAYKLHIDKLTSKEKTQPTAAQKEEAARSAIYQAQETNGGTVLETAPSISQNALGRVAFMYKPYGLQMYYTMLKSTKQALDKSNFTKEERLIAVKQLIGIHATALFFAGVYGIPLYGAISMLFNIFFLGDEDEDVDTIVRKYIGEGFFKGVPTMAGIDVSNRIRLTGLLIQNNRYNQVRGADDIEGFLGFHLGGPALSTGKRLVRGGMDLYNGETRRGIESLLPAGIANMFKVFPGLGRINAEGGYKTRRGDPIYDDVSLGEKFGQFIGFAPTEYTFQQERNSILKGIDTATNKKRTKLLRKYYIANTMGDWDGLQDTQKEMRKFNRDHPTHTITAETIERSMKSHRKTTQLMHHGVKFSSALEQAMKENSAQWDQGLQLFK